MSLKDKVESMRIVTQVKACHHGYELTQVVPVLYAYIAELEAKLDKPKASPAKPAAKKPAAKQPAAKKKAPAKKKS